MLHLLARPEERPGQSQAKGSAQALVAPRAGWAGASGGCKTQWMPRVEEEIEVQL